MDRGMVSEGNPEFLREEGREYGMGTPRSEMKKWERKLLDRMSEGRFSWFFFGQEFPSGA